MNPLSEKAEQALKKAAAHCAKAERCTAEIEALLQLYQLSQAEEAKVIERLKKEGFLNERRYAYTYAQSKFEQNGWGKIKIREAMINKGIDENLAEEAVEEIDPQAYIERLKKLIADKQRNTKGRTSKEIAMKLARFALSRGFEWEEVEDLLPEAEEDDDLYD